MPVSSAAENHRRKFFIAFHCQINLRPKTCETVGHWKAFCRAGSKLRKETTGIASATPNCTGVASASQSCTKTCDVEQRERGGQAYKSFNHFAQHPVAWQHLVFKSRFDKPGDGVLKVTIQILEQIAESIAG